MATTPDFKKPKLWVAARWCGLAFLILTWMSGSGGWVVWGTGRVQWQGWAGWYGLGASLTTQERGTLVRPQGISMDSHRVPGYASGNRWMAWTWTEQHRRLHLGLPVLIVGYLVAWSAAHCIWQRRKSRLLKLHAAPLP